MNTLHVFDPDRLRINAVVPKSKSVFSRRTPFLKGPIPLAWLQRAARCPGRSLHVGILLWYAVGLMKTHTISLSYKKARDFGLDRHAVGRGLQGLEKGGLIQASRRQGRSPLVTVLEAMESDPCRSD